MVTTRSQEKGLSTPVSSSKLEVLVPLTTRSTPSTTDSPSVTRKTRSTRSTPRRSDSTTEDAKQMGTSASKAAAPPKPSANVLDGILAKERHDGVENPARDATHELAQQALEENPTPQPQLAMQDSSTTDHDLTLLKPVIDPDDSGSTNLPERLKFSPPAGTATSLNRHKRFRSEEPDIPATLKNERDTEAVPTTVESFATPQSFDESDGAPEVVTSVSRKSTSRLSKGRKRRRLEEDVAGQLELPRHEPITGTPASEQISLAQHTINDNTGSAPAQPNNHATSVPSALEQSKEPVGQKSLEGANLESGVLQSDPNTPVLAATQINETNTTLQDNSGPEPDAGTRIISSDVTPSLSGIDAILDPGLAEPDFKMPLLASHEAKISGLNAEPVNTTALDDAECGSHTEAGSATLTNNSFVTVPESQSLSHGETTSSASANIKHQTLAEKMSLPLNQKPSPKHMTMGRQVRPSMAMPQPPPKPTSLQDYRRELLNRNPRTNVWGPPGIRRTRFVGA